MAIYHSNRAAAGVTEALSQISATPTALSRRAAPIAGISNIASEVSTQSANRVITVAVPGMQGARGPQGPEPDLTFLDTAAVKSLTSADRGSVLEWNGSQYAPSSLLENDLTISGGNF